MFSPQNPLCVVAEDTRQESVGEKQKRRTVLRLSTTPGRWEKGPEGSRELSVRLCTGAVTINSLLVQNIHHASSVAIGLTPCLDFDRLSLRLDEDLGEINSSLHLRPHL